MQLLQILAEIDNWLDQAADVIVTAANDRRTWDNGVLAVMRADAASSKRTLHIRQDVVGEVLGEELQELLISSGMVPRKTEYRTRLGTTRKPTFDILYDDLVQCASETVDEATKDHQYEGRIRLLKRENRLLREERLRDTHLLELIHGASQAVRARKPMEPLRVSRASRRNLAGWATLFLSDWHWDEVVNPREVEGLNEYRHDIAVNRAKHTFTTTGELLLSHMSGAYYEGLVVMLGGDMLSGNIHEELRRSNAAPVTESILTITDVLVAGIKMLAAEFPMVYVPCVVGNHGRLDRKPIAKGRVEENYDWLVYQLVARELADVPNVRVDVSTATDIQFELYNTVYRLTHGDQFRGGGGIGGKWPTLMRGDYRKRKRSLNTGGGYDYLVMGHWHAYGIVDGLIVNGSLKGYDEYAYVSNFDYEPPTQALWGTHPDYGLTFQWPVYSDGARRATAPNSFSTDAPHEATTGARTVHLTD